MSGASRNAVKATDVTFDVRPATAGDLAAVIALDAKVTGVEKNDYWRDVFARSQSWRQGDGFFLVAVPAPGETTGAAGPALLGFIIGELRAWEFGSTPCGWIFAVSVDPDARLGGVATALFEAMSAGFRAAGVTRLRTMIAPRNTLLMSFFRSHGMMAGPYLQLEKDLDD